jgi:putative flippase GtrA
MKPMSVIESIKKKLEMMDIRKFIKFSLVGVVNTVVFYGIYYVLLQVGLVYAIALTVSNIVAIANSYVLNKLFTFKTKEKSFKETVRFFIVAGIQYLLNLLIVHVCVSFIGISATLAGVIAIGITVFISYFGHKLWTFRE